MNSFRNMWGTDILVAPHTHNSKGVAILTKNVDVTFEAPLADENGNYLIVKASINKCSDVVIANVYGPNIDCPDFFEKIDTLCLKSAGDNTPWFIAGDLKIALNSELDTCNYVRENNLGARNRVFQMMHNNNLIDVFREMHGSTKRYTWRVRNPVLKQARLDYFLVSDQLLSRVLECDIVPGYRTDHSMIKLKFSINEEVHG